MRLRNVLTMAKVGILLTAPAVLAGVPTSFLDGGRTLCLWKNLFGVDCPGCGTVRAVSSLCHADFAGAMAYNRLIVVTGPLLAATWAAMLYTSTRALLAARRKRAAATD